jgi:hypothetical protein
MKPESEILQWFQENNPKTLAEINAAGIETEPYRFGRRA